ncbi:hypothetical protein LTR78_001168 [Recurvomyces mirabilis]|uniref:DH domain-containing protein n=1 Tax=Recurvomyces mirabilis TaxID=574656 RepID=A0AAE0WVM5_9PEZI|nr:hypothetical protein LTR78_001168 [Recurvomyces mirabilis]KAK5161144.1 hypothetical protein LTS14_000940 [Recurvomyces mirabilis]
MSNLLGSYSDLHGPMPSPNGANKSSAKKTPEKKGQELGQRLAKRRSQDFTSKVQGWSAAVAQQHNEVVVVQDRSEVSSKKKEVVEVVVESTVHIEDDAVADEVEIEGEAPTTPAHLDENGKPSPKVVVSAHTSREVDLERKAWIRRKSKPQVEVALDLKHAGLPKKRVVSDGHWRKDRTAKQAAASTPEKETTPKPTVIRRSVVNVGLKVPPYVQAFVEEERAPTKVRPLRGSHSPSREREREGTPDYEDSGVKVYIKRRKRSQTTSDPSASQSSLTAGSSVEKRTVSTANTTPPHSPTKRTPPRPSTAPKERQSRVKDVEPEQRRPSRSKSKPDLKPKAEVKPTDKVANRLAAPIAPGVYNKRIDGWLATTSDPFVESRDASLTPEPLDVQRKQTRRSGEAPHDNSDDEHRRSSGRRRASRQDLGFATARHRDDDEAPSPSATPTLRRAGARRSTHSPVKDRPARERSPHGRALSTIASAETLRPLGILEGSVLSRASDGDEPGLQRRLTKHSDLISVLSRARGEGGRRKSTRSVRRRPLSNDATLQDLMNELTTDELKYQRELRTLVDGVIPVLLTYVLQKTDATGAKRLFSGSSPDGQAVTRPIVEMGVALEKLKLAHKRIPLHDPHELVKWAENAFNKYAEYLKAWRLGFQDVVVNLAPADKDEPSPRKPKDGLAAKDGEKADVQYLLKRPLVRLKYLTKTFRSIQNLEQSPAAESIAEKYHTLVEEARRRASDERARLEDEAAANIDPSRARDPRTLAPLAEVFIDPTRTVRARDYFDLEVFHSTGQQLTCKIELVMRDDLPHRGSLSDMLFCDVSLAGRWLLYPPIPAAFLSARAGDKDGEIIVMIRGTLSGGGEWRELLSLRSQDDGAVDDWLGLLRSDPAPPRLMRQSSFNALRASYHKAAARAPSPSEVDAPIGERVSKGAQKWDASDVMSVVDDLAPSATLRRTKATRHRSAASPTETADTYEQVHTRANRIAEQQQYDETPRSRYHQRSKSSYFSQKSEWSAPSEVSTPSKDYSVWMPSTDRGSNSSGSDDERDEPISSKRPSLHKRTSSTPSMDMPTIRKLRKAPPSTPQKPTEHHRSRSEHETYHEEPRSAPSKLQKRQTTPPEETSKPKDKTPAQRPTSIGLRSGILPSFTPNFLKKHRRASSPLKHEYAPSTASESLSDSDFSDHDDVESITSESSAEEQAVSTIGELRDFRNMQYVKPSRQQAPKQPTPPTSEFSGSGGSLRPSESASQGPYRTIPPAISQSLKTVASIFAWSEKGTWDSLHPQECCIIVTPGLIEAFDLAQAGAVLSSPSSTDIVSPSQKGVKPLIALELTPLVPLRRGTALDISIRSPPTPNSVMRASNNLMFRSQSSEDCEKLYHLINRARIDNPTYIALQQARGPVPTSNWAEVMDRRNAARTASSSWLRLGSKKSSTYRSTADGRPRAVSTAATESSLGTVNSAFSALRRFSGSKSVFNIAKSTLTSREGTRSTYSDSLDSGGARTPTMHFDRSMGTPLGINNTKIRLYVRESMQKWRDMGSARLSVLLPPRPQGSLNPAISGMEKRILICGKSKGETLLDVILPEGAFERVARTGIAVSVWEESVAADGRAVVADTGGVSNARTRIYMMQMKSEREAVYTFGLVGKFRY